MPKNVIPIVMTLAMLQGCGDNPDYDCVVCGDDCVYLSQDPLHCGACDNACHDIEICEFGECVCPGGGEVCGDACVDTATDPLNCGECGNVCAMDSDCTDGECEEELTAYGTVNVSFTSAFIYDGPMYDLDPDYVWAHFTDGVVRVPVFTGTYGDSLPIPHPDTEANLTHAAHFPPSAGAGIPAQVVVDQSSYLDAAWLEVANPMARIVFAGDEITSTTYDLDPTGELGTAGLFIYEVLDLETGDICILAVGHGGSISVSDATDTTAIDGGTLALEGSDIPIYHPTGTPLGDLSADIVDAGMSVCPIE